MWTFALPHFDLLWLLAMVRAFSVFPPSNFLVHSMYSISCFWEVETLLTTASKPTDHLCLLPHPPSAQGEGWAYICSLTALPHESLSWDPFTCISSCPFECSQTFPAWSFLDPAVPVATSLPSLAFPTIHPPSPPTPTVCGLSQAPSDLSTSLPKPVSPTLCHSAQWKSSASPVLLDTWPFFWKFLFTL